MRDETLVRVVTILVLGVVLLASVVGLTVVAVTTDRDLFRAEVFTFGGTAILAALGGVSWYIVIKKRDRHRDE